MRFMFGPFKGLQGNIGLREFLSCGTWVCLLCESFLLLVWPEGLWGSGVQGLSSPLIRSARVTPFATIVMFCPLGPPFWWPERP